MNEVPTKETNQEDLRDELSALSNENLISDEVISADDALEEKDGELAEGKTFDPFSDEES